MKAHEWLSLSLALGCWDERSIQTPALRQSRGVWERKSYLWICDKFVAIQISWAKMSRLELRCYQHEGIKLQPHGKRLRMQSSHFGFHAISVWLPLMVSLDGCSPPPWAITVRFRGPRGATHLAVSSSHLKDAFSDLMKKCDSICFPRFLYGLVKLCWQQWALQGIK